MIPDQTQAAIISEPRGGIAIASVPIREPGRGEALIQMEACGLCHSDLFVAGLPRLPLLPLTLGHEGIGRIEAVGAGVTGFSAGERVGMTFLASTCGECPLCQTGRERFCAKQLNFGYTVAGALAGYVTVPVPQLVRVPRDLPASEAAPLCCAGWTAYGAMREAGLTAGQSVAVFGMGGLGHLAVQYARHKQLRVAAVDVSQPKLELARELGVEVTLLADDAGRSLQKQFGGVDAAIVLTASSAAIREAFRALKRTGTLVLVGLSGNEYELPIVDTVMKGITVRGSYLGARQDIEDVFRLAQAGVARPYVETHELAETPDLLQKMRLGELKGRAVIVF